jgi:hypothetical protein
VSNEEASASKRHRNSGKDSQISAGKKAKEESNEDAEGLPKIGRKRKPRKSPAKEDTDDDSMC